MKHDKEKLLDVYGKLYLTRHYDDAVRELSVKGLWTFYHGIVGEEAIPVGVCSALEEDDYVVPVHRTQLGVMVSRGVDLPRLTAELLGRDGGYCRGISGTHMACMERGVLSKTGILGAGLPVATGVGLAVKLRGADRVAAVFIGDGASSSGNFHESLNMAAIWDLPVIYVLENNHYAITTQTSYALAVEELSKRAVGYGIPGVIVDGNDVLEVYEAACEAAERARGGSGPTLLECKTYRIWGHHGHGTDEELGYRSREEVEEWEGKNPVRSLRARLLEEGAATERELGSLEAGARASVKAAVDFAIGSPFPPAELVVRRSREEV